MPETPVVTLPPNENPYSSRPNYPLLRRAAEFPQLAPVVAPGNLRGSLIATQVITTTGTLTPASAQRIGNGWTVESELPGTGGILLAGGNRSLAIQDYVPSNACFGWMFEAEQNGAVISRVVLPLGGRQDVEDGVVVPPPAPIMELGRQDPNTQGQLIEARYIALQNGTLRLEVRPVANRYTNGVADRWCVVPAGITVKVYEAIVEGSQGPAGPRGPAGADGKDGRDGTGGGDAYTLPTGLQQFNAAVTPNHRLISGAVGQVAHLAARTLTQANAEDFGDFYQSGSRLTNRYFILKLTDAEFDEGIIRIGPTDGFGTPGSIVAEHRVRDSQDVTHLGDDKYQYQLADLPGASAITVVDLELDINSRDVEFDPPLYHPRNNAPPLATALPSDPERDDTYRIFGELTYPKTINIPIENSADIPPIHRSPVEIGGGLPGYAGRSISVINSYAAGYTGPAALAGKTWLVIGGSTAGVDGSNLVITFDGVDYPVTNTNAGGSFTHFFEAPTLTYEILTAGQHTFRIRNTSTGDAYPEEGSIGIAHEESVVTYQGNQVWAYSALYPAPWARQGRPAPANLRAQTVASNEAAGVSVNMANNLQRGTAPVTVSPNFDLDDNVGVVFGEVRFVLVNPSLTTLGYSASGDATVIVPVSFRTAAVPRYVAGSNPQGLTINPSVKVYNGTTEAVDVHFRVVDNAAGLLQLIVDTDRVGGAPNPNFTFTVQGLADLYFLPTS